MSTGNARQTHIFFTKRGFSRISGDKRQFAALQTHFGTDSGIKYAQKSSAAPVSPDNNARPGKGEC